MNGQTLSRKPLNGCPRCGGAMIVERDHWGSFSTCLACGYVYEPSLVSREALLKEREPKGPRRRPS